MERSHVVPVIFQLFFDKSTYFGQPINGFAAINTHVSVMYNVHKTVHVNDFLWGQPDGDADILVIYGSSNVVPR